MKRTGLIVWEPRRLARDAAQISALAGAKGLRGHAAAGRVRLGGMERAR